MRRALLSLCLVLLAATASAEPPPLRNNPFSRPPVLTTADDVVPVDERSNVPLRLVATMVGARNQIANVEGRVLRAGDEIRGYKLKRVFEDRAIFERNGNEIVVYVKPELENQDEEPTPRRRGR